jgi:AmpD protein
MSTKEITKKIQAGVGVTADGIYGPNTALAIIKGLKLSEKELTKFIQEKVGSLPDGLYGKNTGKSILDSLGLGTKEKEQVSVPSAIVDGKYPEVYKASPNVSSSRIVPEGVVLHHSSGSYNGSVSWILQDKSNVSYHCIIDKDGSRTSFAEDDRRCWHAGKSRFKGRGGCNGFLLGLAFSGNTKTRELTEDEIASAVEWLLPRFEKWDWPTDLSTVTTHKEISPGRKDDVDSRAEQAILKALKAAL